MSRRAAARRYEISKSVAIKWLERVERDGSREPVGHGGHRASKLMPHRDFLEAARAEKSDVTLQALCDRLSAERGVKADTSMMSRFFRRIGVTVKKKTLVAREQDRPDISRHRKRWRTYPGLIDPRRLVFIDETWTKTNMTRLRGWAPRGERLVDKVPAGQSEKTGGTRSSPRLAQRNRIDAPCLFDGPINGERFHAYVEQFLAAEELKPEQTSVITRQYSSFPQGKGGAQGDPGCREPASSSCRNTPTSTPIEQVFAKFKNSAAKGGSAKLRRRSPTQPAARNPLAQYPPAECAAYLKNAGYA